MADENQTYQGSQPIPYLNTPSRMFSDPIRQILQYLQSIGMTGQLNEYPSNGQMGGVSIGTVNNPLVGPYKSSSMDVNPLAVKYIQPMSAQELPGTNTRTPEPNVPQLSPLSKEPGKVTSLSTKDERAFQSWIKGTDFYKEFIKEYGEPPDLNIDTYDYRGAWKAGVQPKRYPYDFEPNKRTGYVPPEGGRYHWGGFKNPNHPTYWATEFMNITGIDPGQLKLKTREESQEWLNKNYRH